MQTTVTSEMLELLAEITVPRLNGSDVGGAEMTVWSWPEPCRKHHGFRVTCSLKVPGLAVSRYCFCCDASVMLASAAPIVGNVAPPGSIWTLFPFPTAPALGATPYFALRSWCGERCGEFVAM